MVDHTAFAEMVREATRHATHPEISLAAKTIHNPAESRHFMSLRLAPWAVTVTLGGQTLAESENALVCLEIGKEMYLPIYYVPMANVGASLVPFKHETHCPLKGDSSYLALPGDTAPIGWRYAAPLDFASALKDRVAFDHQRVSITTSPL